MEKYLGNKTVLLPLIEEFISQRVPAARSISDLFAGTTNVSRHFRRAGFDVATGDLNRFSYALGRAYLTHTTSPAFAGIDTSCNPADIERLRFAAEQISRRAGRASNWAEIEPLARAIAVLQAAGRSNTRRGIIFEHFTREGRRSHFVSLRGTPGRRNYFSKENALILDGLLETLRRWRTEEKISSSELFLLLASVIEEVVITANVSGTFHDFSRDRLWPNANQVFTLRMPPLVLAGGRAEIVNADALQAATAMASHDICYIDPPYNFRQYGAYYHLLNFVAAYPFLEEPQAYANDLAFVRGQNRKDDHTSSFCFKDDFIGSLRTLIERVPSEHVVLSYYGGRNHWNHWSNTETPTDRGLRELSALFRDKGLFDACEVVPVLSVRQNYQSRVGETKKLVDEYLLMGSRTKVPGRRRVAIPALQANKSIGIAQHFGHFVSRTKEGRAGGGRSDLVAVAVG